MTRILTDAVSDAVSEEDSLSCEIVELAKSAGVLELLAAKPENRKALGCAADEYLVQASMGALRLHDLQEISKAMQHYDIPLAPLKGMVYALMFETGGPTRAMADIDLLVPPEKFESAIAVMLKLGYEEILPVAIARAAGYHERSLIKNNRLVEIHRFFLPGARINVDYRALWKRTIHLDSDGVLCQRLSAEDTFLFHCLHMGIHEFSHGGLRAVWELRRLILEDKPDLNVAASRAREWGTVKITWSALELLKYCFPNETHCCPQVLKMFEPSFSVRWLLKRFVVEPSIKQLIYPAQLSRKEQLFRKALLVDRFSGAASYLWWYINANAISDD